MSLKTLICFDYGEKRIGIAVGQTLTATATPVDTILVKQGKPEWQKISKLIEHWQPEALIVGQPLHLDGARQWITDLAEKFGRQLQGRYHLPVHYADERLSSFEARRRLKQVTDLDPVAAQVILETWIAEHNRTL